MYSWKCGISWSMPQICCSITAGDTYVTVVVDPSGSCISDQHRLEHMQYKSHFFMHVPQSAERTACVGTCVCVCLRSSYHNIMPVLSTSSVYVLRLVWNCSCTDKCLFMLVSLRWLRFLYANNHALAFLWHLTRMHKHFNTNSSEMSHSLRVDH